MSKVVLNHDFLGNRSCAPDKRGLDPLNQARAFHQEGISLKYALLKPGQSDQIFKTYQSDENYESSISRQT